MQGQTEIMAGCGEKSGFGLIGLLGKSLRLGQICGALREMKSAKPVAIYR